MIDSKAHERDLQRQLKRSGSDDEVQSTERFAKSGYDFINTAGHGFLVIPIDSPDYMLAKKIVKYGYIGELGIYLEEDDEAPEFLRQVKKFNLDDFILPTNLDFDDSEVRKKMNMHGLLPEDILKYGTKDEIKILKESSLESIDDLRTAAREIEAGTNGAFQLIRIKPDGKGVVKINGILGEMWETPVTQEDFYGQSEFIIFYDYPGAGSYGVDKHIEGTSSKLIKRINNMKITKEDDEEGDRGYVYDQFGNKSYRTPASAYEDIYKYGTKDEIIFLLENWRGKLQGEYNDFEEFKQYDEMYGLSKRLGFNSPEEAWEANPLIQGGINPKDYKVVKDFHRVKVCARCGKKLKRGERGGVCDMCADDIDKGRDRE